MPPRCSVRSSKRFRPSTVVAIAAAAAIAACGAKDAIARAGATADTSRIVAIGGAVTEILYELGMADKIVAVDTTSLYPPQAMKEKSNVGYMRQLSAEGVLGINPTLILAAESAGPKETMDILRTAGIPLVTVPDLHTGDGIVEKIRIVAAAVGRPRRGQCLIDRVRADIDALAKIEKPIEHSRRVLFLLSFVGGRAMVSGRDTAADGIIRLARAINAVQAFDGYKPISDESVVAARPDAVLAMQRSGPLNITAEAVFRHAGFAATPAASERKLILMDGLYLLGFGPRTARAARDLAAALYPELKDGTLPSERAPTAPCPT